MLFRRKSDEDRRIERILEQAERDEEQIQLRRRVQRLMASCEQRNGVANTDEVPTVRVFASR